MLTTFRDSFKTPIQAQNDDLPLGLLIDMVINPHTGVFEAFWVKGLDEAKLLLPKDILFWDNQQITISDQNDLSSPSQLPRLNKIFEQECSVLKAPVYDIALKKNLGQVFDFTFDTISPRLLALEVKCGWLGIKRQRIPQHRIQCIESNRIVVDSSALKPEAPVEKLSKKLPVLEVPELDGPRRKDK